MEQERVRQLRLHVLEALAAALSAEGRYGLAVEAALAAVQAEPLRESAHRALIAVHLREGNGYEALRQYESFRERCRRELGVPPSPRIERMLAVVRIPSPR